MLNKRNEYTASFLFGAKLLSLLSLLFVPPLLWACVALHLSEAQFLEKMPMLNTQPLTIIGARRGEELAKETRDQQKGAVVYHLGREDGTLSLSGPKESGKLEGLYLVTNRAYRNTAEKEKIEAFGSDRIDAIARSLAGDESFEKATHQEQEQILNSKAAETSGTVICSERNALGNFVYFLLLALALFLTIACLASYFPMTKAIINLFSSRKGTISKSAVHEKHPLVNS